MHKEIYAWNKRKGHQRLRWLGKEVLHILLTFAVGVAIATLYHELVTSKSIRSGAERICTLYGKDEEECKQNIDSVLNMSDAVLDNNVNVKGV